MSAQAMTIISGVVLLAVFVFVAWTLSRRDNRGAEGRASQRDGPGP